MYPSGISNHSRVANESVANESVANESTDAQAPGQGVHPPAVSSSWGPDAGGSTAAERALTMDSWQAEHGAGSPSASEAEAPRGGGAVAFANLGAREQLVVKQLATRLAAGQEKTSARNAVAEQFGIGNASHLDPLVENLAPRVNRHMQGVRAEGAVDSAFGRLAGSGVWDYGSGRIQSPGGHVEEWEQGKKRSEQANLAIARVTRLATGAFFTKRVEIGRRLGLPTRSHYRIIENAPAPSLPPGWEVGPGRIQDRTGVVHSWDRSIAHLERSEALGPFLEWVREALERGMTKRMLAEKLGVPTVDLDALLWRHRPAMRLPAQLGPQRETRDAGAMAGVSIPAPASRTTRQSRGGSQPVLGNPSSPEFSAGSPSSEEVAGAQAFAPQDEELYTATPRPSPSDQEAVNVADLSDYQIGAIIGQVVQRFNEGEDLDTAVAAVAEQFPLKDPSELEETINTALESVPEGWGEQVREIAHGRYGFGEYEWGSGYVKLPGEEPINWDTKPRAGRPEGMNAAIAHLWRVLKLPPINRTNKALAKELGMTLTSLENTLIVAGNPDQRVKGWLPTGKRKITSPGATEHAWKRLQAKEPEIQGLFARYGHDANSQDVTYQTAAQPLSLKYHHLKELAEERKTSGLQPTNLEEAFPRNLQTRLMDRYDDVRPAVDAAAEQFQVKLSESDAERMVAKIMLGDRAQGPMSLAQAQQLQEQRKAQRPAGASEAIPAAKRWGRGPGWLRSPGPNGRKHTWTDHERKPLAIRTAIGRYGKDVALNGNETYDTAAKKIGLSESSLHDYVKAVRDPSTNPGQTPESGRDAQPQEPSTRGSESLPKRLARETSAFQDLSAQQGQVVKRRRPREENGQQGRSAKRSTGLFGVQGVPQDPARAQATANAQNAIERPGGPYAPHASSQAAVPTPSFPNESSRSAAPSGSSAPSGSRLRDMLRTLDPKQRDEATRLWDEGWDEEAIEAAMDPSQSDSTGTL